MALLTGALIGIGGTIILDVWIALNARILGAPSRDWSLVGRWIAQFPRGRFAFPEGIARVPRVAGELALGWAFHYAVGGAYGIALVCLAGPQWLNRPTLPPALAVGIVSLAAPFLVMDPALGNGFFAMRSPRPWVARARSLVNHIVFAVGLYASAMILR